ncbi:RNA-directed DNA polymerase from mobile element jockey [Dictyocoela roeselum]|nr:RNA-directed DNA polymerase from mobile element jockey [Dictyocoela roeselum]
MKHGTIPHIKNNHKIRTINLMYDTQRHDIINNCPSKEKYSRLIALRNDLHSEYLILKNEQLENLISQTDMERNSKDFWMSIKRMIGNNSLCQQKYMKDHNNKEIYDDKGKEKLFREYWSKVFKISVEENAEFDHDTELEVNNYIIDNTEKIVTYPRVDNNRLADSINPVQMCELKKIINSMKQKAPGEDEITKYHLINMPNNMLLNLQKIINASLSIGHYPSVWKTSIMIFLPKPNKSPLEHSN